MSQTLSVVAGGTAAVLLLGFGTWLVFADPARTSSALGGPLVVTSATTAAPLPSAAPDRPASEGTAVAALPARRAAGPAASAAREAPLDAQAGTPAAPVAAPPRPGAVNGSGHPRGGPWGVDPATSSPGSGHSATAPAVPTDIGGSNGSGDSARHWLTINPGRWGGSRSALVGRSGLPEPSPVVSPTPSPDATTWWGG